MPKYKEGDRIIETRRQVIYDLVSYDEKEGKWLVYIVHKGNDESVFEDSSTRLFSENFVEQDELYSVYLADLQFDHDLKHLLED